MIHTLQFIKTMIIGLNEQRRSEEGATATEYGLLVGLIALGIVLMVTAFGTALSNFFDGLGDTVGGWGGGGGTTTTP
jgi:pilus assembly protein Flp/PilA